MLWREYYIPLILLPMGSGGGRAYCGSRRAEQPAFLQEGTIEIIATDHAPHSKEEKDKPLDQAPSGITGIETSLALGVTELVEKGYLSMMQLLEKMTINPAKLYNMEQGRLQEGKPADVVLFDPEEEWEVKEYKSKATNSPFTGWKLKGKVKYTICDGKTIEL